MQCSKCGKPLAQGSQFCNDCGNPVVANVAQQPIQKVHQTKSCKKCHMAILKTTKICPNCGTKQGLGPLKIAGIVVLSIFALGVLGNLTDKGEDEAPPPPEAAVVEEVQEPPKELTDEEKIHAAIEETIKETNREGVKRFSSMQIDGDTLMIWLNADDVLTAKMIFSVATKNSIDIYPVLFRDLQYNEIIITWLFPFQDEYGESKDLIIKNFALKREDAEKVQWEEIFPENFESLALVWQRQL